MDISILVLCLHCITLSITARMSFRNTSQVTPPSCLKSPNGVPGVLLSPTACESPPSPHHSTPHPHPTTATPDFPSSSQCAQPHPAPVPGRPPLLPALGPRPLLSPPGIFFLWFLADWYCLHPQDCERKRCSVSSCCHPGGAFYFLPRSPAEHFPLVSYLFLTCSLSPPKSL